jgi:MFS family permease
MPDVDPRIRSSLRSSLADGAFFSINVGAGENLIAPAAVHLNATPFQLAWLTAIPNLAGAFSQFVSAEITDRTRRRKPLFLVGAAIHALMWLPILASLAMPSPGNVYVLIGGYALSMMALHLVNPPWMSTMGDLVPADSRGRYFGLRNLISGTALIASALSAGLILHLETNQGRPEVGFMICFAGALAARLVSVFFLSRLHEPRYEPRPEDRFTLVDFLRRAPRSNFAKFVLYSSAMHLSVAIAGPFFAPYQLRILGLGYGEYVLSQTAHLLGLYMTMQAWGVVTDRAGSRRVMQVASLGVSIVPLTWLWAHNLPTVVAVQVFSGVCWAGYSLSTTNFIFDAVTPAKRARCSAYYTAFTLASVFLGSMLGGLLTELFRPALERGLMPVAARSEIQYVIFVSGLLRFATMALFLRKFREVRTPAPMKLGEIVLRVFYLRPFASLIFDLAGRRRDGEKR